MKPITNRNAAGQYLGSLWYLLYEERYRARPCINNADYRLGGGYMSRTRRSNA